MAARWVTMAEDGDHYRLAFDKPGTWSQKYNLVWDRILGLELFPPEVARKELEWYLSVQQEYGLPLDSRSTVTKLDWIIWSATLAEDRKTFERLVEPAYRFVNTSPDRLPLSDRHLVDSGAAQGFTARSVVGGLFIPMLADAEMWRRWVSRAGALEP